MTFKSKEAKEMLKRAGLTPAQARYEIAKARQKAEGLISTVMKHTDPKTGTYTLERQKVHAQAIKHFVAKNKKAGRDVFLTGGKPGSGKGGLVKLEQFKEKYKNAVLLDPDEFKQWLAKYDGLKDASVEAAAYHQESVELFLQAKNEAIRQGKTVIMDGTMRQLDKMEDIISKFKTAGYKTEIAFADLPDKDTALRGLGRYFGEVNKKGVREYGRFVDPTYIMTHGTKNAEVLDVLKKQVDGYSKFSTKVAYGQKPILLESGGTHAKGMNADDQKPHIAVKMINPKLIDAEKRMLLDARGEKFEDFNLFWVVSDGEDDLLAQFVKSSERVNCFTCKHYDKEKAECPAFPNKSIPIGFQNGQVPHKEEVKGQVKNILFTEREAEEN